MPSRHEVMAQAIAQLTAANIDNATQEARWLWEAVRGETAFLAAVAKRCTGNPLAYVVGEWPFLGQSFLPPQ
ncbi:MAG: hypothetical protein AAB066_01075, partial [Candidatus Margulisiibacteriota bacterium]